MRSAIPPTPHHRRTRLTSVVAAARAPPHSARISIASGQPRVPPMPRCPDNTNANPTIDPGTRHALTSNQPRRATLHITTTPRVPRTAPVRAAPAAPASLALSSSPGSAPLDRPIRHIRALRHLHTLARRKGHISSTTACAHTSLTPTATAGGPYSAHRCRRRRHRTGAYGTERPASPPAAAAAAVVRARRRSRSPLHDEPLVSFSMTPARSTRNFAASAP